MIDNITNITKSKKKLKTDREVQFWETEECRDIISKCSKEDILNWIKNNSGKSIKEIYDNFGIGSIKLKNELILSKDITQKDGNLFYG